MAEAPARPRPLIDRVTPPPEAYTFDFNCPIPKKAGIPAKQQSECVHVVVRYYQRKICASSLLGDFFYPPPVELGFSKKF